MAFDANDALPRALHAHNPWWADGADALDLPSRQKSDFYHLVRPDDPGTQFEDQRVLGLVGRRGAGKTTLCHQFVEHEIEHGRDPAQFCYLPFDANPLYQLNADDQLRRAVAHYDRRIRSRIDDDSPHFFVLDDVHRIEHRDKPTVDGWGTPVTELLADAENRHVVVTASAGVQVDRELARVDLDTADYDTQPILPEKFRDYLYTVHPDLEDEPTRVSPTSIRTGSNSLPATLEDGDVDRLVAELREKHDRVADHRRRIEAALLTYLHAGGIIPYESPEPIESDRDLTDAHFQRLREDTRDALYQDVPGFESIKTIADLERLCSLAAETRAREPLQYRDLVDLFDVDRRTIADSYLPALEALYLLTGTTEYDNSRPRAIRLYLRDTGLVNALSDDDWSELRDDYDRERDLARIVAYDHTMRFAYGVDAMNGIDATPSVAYWQSRDAEVDYVFEHDGTPVPIALAYHSRERDEKRDVLAAFRREYDAPLALLLDGEPQTGLEPVRVDADGIVELPYWLYLLIC